MYVQSLLVQSMKINSILALNEWQHEFLKVSHTVIPKDKIQLVKQLFLFFLSGISYPLSGFLECRINYKKYSAVCITVSVPGYSGDRDFERIFGVHCRPQSVLKVTLPHGNARPSWFGLDRANITSSFSFRDIWMAHRILVQLRQSKSEGYLLGKDMACILGFLKFAAFHLHLERVLRQILSTELQVVNFSFEGIFWERLLIAVGKSYNHRLEGFQRGVFFPHRLRFFLVDPPSKLHVSGPRVARYVEDRVGCQTAILGVTPTKIINPKKRFFVTPRKVIYISQGDFQKDRFWLHTIEPIFTSSGLITHFKNHPLVPRIQDAYRPVRIIDASIEEIVSQRFLLVGYDSFAMIEARLLGGDVVSLINFSNDTEVGWMPFVHCPRTLNELKNLLEDLPKEELSESLSAVKEWYAPRNSLPKIR